MGTFSITSDASTVILYNYCFEGIWDQNDNYVNDNTLTVYIKRIREKLGKVINEFQFVDYFSLSQVIVFMKVMIF